MAETRQQGSNKQRPEQASDHPIGPTSIEGVEASDQPNERGSVDTDPRKVVRRKMPQKTGGQPDGDVGLRGLPDSADSDQHGHV